MNTKRTLRLIIVAAVVLPVAGALLVPAPTTMVSISAGQFQGSMATAILESVFYVGAAILFITGLASFKERLRNLYGVICAALVLTSLVSLQVPFLIAYDIFNGPWVRGGGIAVPNTIASIMFYTSLYLFAKTVGARTRFLSPMFVWLAAVGVALLSTLASTAITPFGFAIEVAGIVFAGASALLALRIRQHIGAAYSKAMKWLAISCAVLGGAYTVASCYDLFFITANPGLGFLYTAASIMFVIAGYSFRKISDQHVSKEDRKKSTSAVEVITYVASLISDVRSLDTVLDTLRDITARVSPGESLSSQDQTRLVKVYLKLEDHLVAHDPVRDFSRESLRTDIQQRFPNHNTREADFWQVITARSKA